MRDEIINYYPTEENEVIKILEDKKDIFIKNT